MSASARRHTEFPAATPLPAFAFLLSILLSLPVQAQNLDQPPDPAAADDPDASLPLFLRYDSGGSDNITRAVQFSADGNTLYVAGWNKVIQVYRRNPTTGRFEYTPLQNFRVPIGDGRYGMLECMVVSADGRWLAAAGAIGSKQRPQQQAWLWPRGASSDETLTDIGGIYVFDTRTRACTVLRGHRGSVRQLTFVDSDNSDNATAMLVSVGFEVDGQIITQSVRAWSLQTAQQVGRALPLPRVIIPPSTNIAPRVRAWTKPDGSVQVAVSAWRIQNGQPVADLFMWNPARDGQRQNLAAAPVGFALESFGNGRNRQLYCGGLGQPALYAVGQAGAVRRRSLNQADGSAVPFAACKLEGNSPAALAVGIQPLPNGDKDYSLHLVNSTRSRKLGQLWLNRGVPGQGGAMIVEPSIAATSDGQWLAVTGSQGNEVRIYRLPELVAGGQPGGELKPFQTLQNDLLIPQQAMFVKRGQQTGIALVPENVASPPAAIRHDAAPPAGSVVLDLQSRRLDFDPSAWQLQIADPGPWQARVTDDNQQVEAANGSAGIRQLLQLPADFRAQGDLHRVTSWAVCAASDSHPPLVAVATHFQGEPELAIYDAATGELFRLLKGHARRITHLAFSRDGDILLSSSLDGTVRGWQLTDLPETVIGKVGWLPGLLTTTRDGKVVIDELSEGGAAQQANMAVGDVIEGVVSDFGFEAFSSAAQFYQYVSQTPPEFVPTITLRTRREARSQDVAVPVLQGADLQRPLFSLLLVDSGIAATSNSNSTSGSWLAWSPAGEFDLVGDQLRQRLGWHINTGNDASPVSFSSVDQYEDRFLQPGLLARLVQSSQTAQRPARRPQLRLSVVTSDGQVLVPNYDDEVLLRSRDGQLVVEFADETGELVDSVTWSVEGQPPVDLTPVEQGLWTSSTPVTTARRGAQLLTVEVVTTDVPPVRVAQSMLLRYQPAAPTMTLQSPAEMVGSVERPQLDLRAAVKTAVPATVLLTHEFGDGDTEETEVVFVESGQLQQQVTLRPGVNRLRLLAVNDGIPEELERHRSLEETRLEATVNYVPAGPPEITIEQIISADGSPVQITDGRFEVRTPTITMIGRVLAESPLQSATIGMPDAPSPAPLADLDPDQPDVLAFSQQVTLKPGPQIVLLEAMAGGEQTQLELTAAFLPPLPVATLITPAESRVAMTATADRTAIPLSFQLQSHTRHPFEWQLELDGTPIDRAVFNLDATTGVLSGTVEVASELSQSVDVHRIELLLSDSWGQQSGIPVVIRLLHPPVLLQAHMQRKSTDAVGDLICQLRASEVRRVQSIRLQINGVDMPAPDYIVDYRDDQLAELVVPQVPLSQGENSLTIAVQNQDGMSNAVTIEETVAEIPRKARLELIQPLSNQTVLRPTQQIQFEVQSEPGLQRVDLIVRQDRRTPGRIALLPNPPAPDTAVSRQFRHTLELTAGRNQVEIVVQNRGGTVRRRLDLTYVPPPVTMQLASLAAADDSWTVPVRVAGEGGIRVETPVPTGDAVVNGVIRWLPGYRPHGDDWTVRVWVNGFLRAARIPAPADAESQTEFSVPVVLNQTDNRLRVESPEVAFGAQKFAVPDPDVAALRRVEVRCVAPERRQRLHLVMMGVQILDGQNIASADELQLFANSALQLEAQANAFAQVRRYAPLVGEKAVGRNLRTLMVLVETEIAQQRTARRMNDVVMFYYRGREHADPSGQFVLEDFQNFENPIKHPQSVNEQYLAELFEHLPGAHVVFLDVLNGDERRATAAEWPQFPNLGLFRIAWSGQAPEPMPPGPLFSTVHDAVTMSLDAGDLRLKRLESAFHTQLGDFKPEGRFWVETYVPEDLAQLVVARLTSASAGPQDQ
jgi:hypothetical protein